MKKIKKTTASSDEFYIKDMKSRGRRKFIGGCRWLKIWDYFYTPMPISLGLQSSILILVILSIMPLHPLAIPTAIGGGISIGLMLLVFRRA